MQLALKIIQFYHRITSFFAFFDDASRIQVVRFGWHAVYSSEKYEVSHGPSSLLGFGEMRGVAGLWGMGPRGSAYFSSEHTAYSPVNLEYLCEAIYYEFISHVRGCRNALPKLTLPRGRFCARTGLNHQVAYLIVI